MLDTCLLQSIGGMSLCSFILSGTASWLDTANTLLSAPQGSVNERLARAGYSLMPADGPQFAEREIFRFGRPKGKMALPHTSAASPTTEE